MANWQIGREKQGGPGHGRARTSTSRPIEQYSRSEVGGFPRLKSWAFEELSAVDLGSPEPISAMNLSEAITHCAPLRTEDFCQGPDAWPGPQILLGTFGFRGPSPA